MTTTLLERQAEADEALVERIKTAPAGRRETLDQLKAWLSSLR